MIGSTNPRRPAGLTTYLLGLAATAVIGAVAGGLAGLMTQTGATGATGAIIAAACAAIALTGMLVVCLWWWNRVDEAAREAHKWAWWWGGTAGTAIGGVFLIAAVAAERVDTSVVSTIPAVDLIYGGALAILLCQVAGYGIAWAVWWLRRR